MLQKNKNKTRDSITPSNYVYIIEFHLEISLPLGPIVSCALYKQLKLV